MNPRRRLSSWIAGLSLILLASAGATRVTIYSVPESVDPSALPSTNLPCSVLTRLLLAEQGITAQVLATAGVDGMQTEVIVATARGLCDVRGMDFDAAFAQYEDASGQVRELEDLVITGRASEADRMALEAARLDLVAAQQAKAVLFAQVRTVIEAVLSEDQQATLDRILASRHIAVPVEYKVLTLTEPEWVEVRDALPPAGGSPTTGPSDTPLDDPGVQSDVLAAREALETNLPDVAVVMESALSD